MWITLLRTPKILFTIFCPQLKNHFCFEEACFKPWTKFLFRTKNILSWTKNILSRQMDRALVYMFYLPIASFEIIPILRWSAFKIISCSSESRDSFLLAKWSLLICCLMILEAWLWNGQRWHLNSEKGELEQENSLWFFKTMEIKELVVFMQ